MLKINIGEIRQSALNLGFRTKIKKGEVLNALKELSSLHYVGKKIGSEIAYGSGRSYKAITFCGKNRRWRVCKFTR